MKKYKITNIILSSILIGFFMMSIFMTSTRNTNADLEMYPNVVKGCSPKEMFRVIRDNTILQNDSPYIPENRNWIGVPNVEVTGNRIWACLYTGGIKEPDPDGKNHSIISVSDDGGEAWIDPYIVNDDPNLSTYMTTPFLAPNGRLFLFIESQNNTYLVYTDNPEAPLNEITWNFLHENADGSVGGVLPSGHLPYNQKPIVIENKQGNSEWIYITRKYTELANGVATRQVGVFVSTNEGKNWSLRALLKNPSDIAKNIIIPEATVVQLNDGRLMLLARIENGIKGGMMRCFSSNNGKTWTDWEYDLEAPYRGPGSKFSIAKTPSGNILLVNNDNTSSRTGLTAYLSTDDGKTFPYSLLIDKRVSSYPDIAIGKDGKIYIINDAMRYDLDEIRLTVLTEQDIINGKYSDENKHNMCVFREKGIDIQKSDLIQNYTFEIGTEIETVLEALPKQIDITYSNGQTILASGEWENTRYWKDKVGTYEFCFKSDDFLEDSQDVHNSITAYVTLKTTSKENGCNGTVLPNCSSLILFAILPTIIKFIRRGKNEKN